MQLACTYGGHFFEIGAAMPKANASTFSAGNRLLARLPEDELQRLSTYFEPISLRSKQTLYPPGSLIEYVYFPINTVTSSVLIMEDGSAIEVATVGNEGMVGLSSFHGADISPNKVFIQIAGNALRMAANVLKKEAGREGPLRKLLLLYHSAYLTQVSYAVACNGLHTIQKRCCRWLLMTQDRVGSDVVALTHEFLGFMLGVRRASVTEVLRPLQSKGLIRTERGKIRIIDRKGMMSIVCECHQAVNKEFDRLLGD